MVSNQIRRGRKSIPLLADTRNRRIAVISSGVLLLIGLTGVFLITAEDVVHRDGLTTHDAGALRLFSLHGSDPWIDTSKMITELGSGLVLGAVAIASVALFWRLGLRLGLALAPIVSFAIAAILVGAIKSIVGRSRPPSAHRLVAASDPSFPSGHATISTAVVLTIALVAAVFVLRRPITRVLAISTAAFVAVLIGVSRLALAVHWPSDVLGGWALGGSLAIGVTLTLALTTRPVPRSDDGPASRFQGLRRSVNRILSAGRAPA